MGNIFTRVGFGYDSHRMISKTANKEEKFAICGVSIPNEKVFVSHSDGDLGVHALIDALLGATALGNIGEHFPDTDEKYQGADSMKLLEETVKILGSNDFKVFNVDITIVIEKPKIAKYIEQMKENIACVLKIKKEFVSIKGKTNEKMDSVGSGEGAMAFAVVSVLQNVDLGDLYGDHFEY
jgi:2-C-methyl-D-erythritol 2,4-cyclodiphosphate synthase